MDKCRLSFHRWPCINNASVWYLYCLTWCINVCESQTKQGRAGMNCNEGYFRCGNGACINKTLICNGIKDCSDNSDEDKYYAECGEMGLSHGFIAVIVIGSIVGAIVLCCWIGSIIECIQQIYKYWTYCVKNHQNVRQAQHRSSGQRGLVSTTVIANQNADPSTVIVARSLPPSYSSVFCNGNSVIQMSSINENKNYPQKQMVNVAVQVNTIDYDCSKSIRWL